MARRCSRGYSRDEPMTHIASKWCGMTKTNIMLSYDLRDSGEVDLMDDEDMETMFMLLDEMQTRRVHVYVKCVDGGSAQALPQFQSELCKEIVEYGTQVFQEHNDEDMELVVQNEEKLRSDQWRELLTGPGQCFPGGAVDFRKAFIKYAHKVGFEFRYVKNDRTRIVAVCKLKNEKGCRWRIRATAATVGDAFYIRSYERNHNYGHGIGESTKKRMGTKIVTDFVVDDIRAMPSMTPIQVMAMVKRNYGIDLTYRVAWKSIDRGRSIVFGDHSTFFAMLQAYLSELERTNLGSHVHLDVDGAYKFKRCFFSFAACLFGFKHCRPMLMVDGTFLKGRHKGILLSVVAKDGDEGLFPIGFALVNEETIDNYEYFFSHLKNAIGAEREIVFISDRSHGIIEAVKKVFPCSPHAYCYKHLKGNLEHRFRGKMRNTRESVLKLFQKCAYVTTKPGFEKCVEQFKLVGGHQVKDFLKGVANNIPY